MSAEAEIVIVGAGPTGLTLACHLLERDVGCRVIDQAPAPTGLSRAIGISPRSLEVFHEIGVAEDAVRRGCPVPLVHIHSQGRQLGQVATSAKTGTRYPFLLTLPQSETEQLLQERFLELGGTLERGVRLVGLDQRPGDEWVSIALERQGRRETIAAQWLIGADGAHSSVRKFAGIEFAGEATDVVFAIVDAHLERPGRKHVGNYYFSPEGLLVLVPLPDGAYRLAATIDALAEDGQALDLDRMQQLVEQRVGGSGVRLRELRNAGWGSTQVRIHTRIAERFRAGRCLLAGDAAHIYSPVGGQGMNSGIQDAYNLAWKLALLIEGRARESLLDSYESERRAVARTVMRATKAQTRMVTIRSRLGVTVRDAVVHNASRLGMLDRRMAPQLAQLDIGYRNGPGIAPALRRGVQGKRAPDVTLECESETPCTLFEVLAESTFTVLVLSPRTSELDAVRQLGRSLAEHYGELVSVRSVWANRDVPSSLECPLIDRSGELHSQLRARKPSAYLIRPDGHVAYAGALSAQASLLTRLEAILGPPRRRAPEGANRL
jgi:2-polyprenyl-6-methoxyphenol hydroxylase-like FAD-dependent oxidoreductase